MELNYLLIILQYLVLITALSHKENMCDIGDLCAQICIPNELSFKCDCNKGYVLMEDGVSCKKILESDLTLRCLQSNPCSQLCSLDSKKETITCSCHTGYTLQNDNITCVDINECELGQHSCLEASNCINEDGGYHCDESLSDGDNSTGFDSCTIGYAFNADTVLCDDIDECEFNIMCPRPQICVNTNGSFYCEDNSSTEITETTTTNEYIMLTTTESTTLTTTQSMLSSSLIPFQSSKVQCDHGLKFNNKSFSCIDIDECQNEEPVCDITQDCYNSIGSYTCICKVGYLKDHQTGACIDFNECQMGIHNCTMAQRCDNTIGSYLCSRITGCGTGYTLNYANGLCEDDNECRLGTHNCKEIGPNFKCRNTLGSYRCDLIPKKSESNNQTASIWHTLKPSITNVRTHNINNNTHSKMKCLPGFVLDQKQVICKDINECLHHPCYKDERCMNTEGSYRCVPVIHCKIGYQLDSVEQKCIDVNECLNGTHSCNPTQICKNAIGYYTCECPPGHQFNHSTRICEDIDECSYYMACSANAKCYNTIGSYQCRCLNGFRENDNQCHDIDECREVRQLCEHNCVNLWGSYRCACQLGFTLSTADNRSCIDVNECEIFKDKRLCIGICDNIPGSYKCSCPAGYRLSSDGRTCKDIDECEENVCGYSKNICLNTRGSYKCYEIVCPPNYYRDPEHKGRCKKNPALCNLSNMQCKTEQYIYHYYALVSDLEIPLNWLQFFQIKGPQWQAARAEYSLEIVNVTVPALYSHRIIGNGNYRVDESYFKIVRKGFNTMQLYLLKSIKGPQEIHLRIKMNLFHNSKFVADIVSYITILVSEYSF